MDNDQKEYFKCMIEESSSFTKTDYRDALSQLIGMLRSSQASHNSTLKELECYEERLELCTMSNMSKYIGRLENQCTAEQIHEAYGEATAPLLNARDEYDRAEAWKKVAELFVHCVGIPDEHEDAKYEINKALKHAHELEKDK